MIGLRRGNHVRTTSIATHLTKAKAGWLGWGEPMGGSHNAGGGDSDVGELHGGVWIRRTAS